MDVNEQDKIFKEMKKKFLAGTLSDYDPKYSRIVEGWQESFAAGADAGCKKLTDSQRDLKVFDRIDDLSKCHLAYFKDYYESRTTALEKMGCAVFYLDTELVAFHKSGSKKLLAELKQKGIRTGTKFSVENVGVFSGNIALGKPFVNCYSAGNGHFTDILSDYVCLSRYGEASVSQGFHAVNVIFIPLERCGKNILNSASFILEAGDFTYKNRILYPHIERRFHLLEQSAQYSTDLLLLVDDSGDIVFINSRLENEFGIHITTIIGNHLRNAFPSLSFVLESLRTGRELAVRNVSMTDKNGEEKHYYVECLPISEGGRVIGLKVSIKTSAQIRKYVADTNPGGAVFTLHDIVGKSTAIAALKRQAKAAATSPANMLITGESGTGKELFAQSIHNLSPQTTGPYIPISCGALRPGGSEAELFGSEEFGPGKFERADGGTLFFDEIWEMPSDMQSLLLRFLEDGIITRPGGKKSIHISARIIASTSRNLLECVEKGSFRPDLYYRLNVMRLDIPPLRQRRADIPILANQFVAEMSSKYKKNIFSLSSESLELLRNYSWPGNIRELKNLIERFIVDAPDAQALVIPELPPDMLGDGSFSGSHTPLVPLQDIKLLESERIKETMLKCNSNKAKAARLLGMSRGTLYKRLEEFCIE